MNLIPGYQTLQQVSIVANSATDINNEINSLAEEGWSLSQLVDKPTNNEVYLIFVKIEQQDHPAT